MSTITMKELLEAGVHFGHQAKRWNPKMKKYIFGERNGIYIIDLQKRSSCSRKPMSLSAPPLQRERTFFLSAPRNRPGRHHRRSQTMRHVLCFEPLARRHANQLCTIKKSIDRLKKIEKMKRTAPTTN